MDRSLFIKELFQYAKKLQYKSRSRFIEEILLDKRELEVMDKNRFTEKILGYARKHIINEFCRNGCEDSCCERGYIITTDQEKVRLIFGIDESTSLEKFADKEIRLEIEYPRLEDISYKIYLNPCPQLDKRSCMIHEDIRRPFICRQYPLIKLKSEIIVRTDCLPVQKGSMNEFINLIERHGYIVNHFP
ncbi:MAG: YkgJ family cysteine cluster protein [Nanoarchaeota archaeon]|nr:YkgJ family cysteine cluster protein [Nanoarchaeota archaeon]